MSTLHITRGLPASGKTTFALEWLNEDPGNRVRVNRDGLRAALYGQEQSGVLAGPLEHQITQVQETIVSKALRSGKDVVVDDMNLRPTYVRRWARLCAKIGAEVRVCEFPATVEESIERQALRPEPCRVPADAIVGMRRYLQSGDALIPVSDLPTAPAQRFEPVEPDGTLPSAIIVDLDGTLAIHNGRSPYDYSRVYEDLPNRIVCEVLELLWLGSHREVIFMSGRPDSCREATERWLDEEITWMEPRPRLYMRAAGDTRDDAVVKYELFDRHVRGRYNVELVFDDRNRVVDMWRQIGLQCWQVAEGDF